MDEKQMIEKHDALVERVARVEAIIECASVAASLGASLVASEILKLAEEPK